MNDLHIRVILLIVIGVLCVGGAVVLKGVGLINGMAMLLMIALGAFLAAVFALLFAGSGSKGDEE